MTNKNNTTLYNGVTSDLLKRVYEHKNEVHPLSFTARYKLFKLVFYEGFKNIEEAIGREKQIKGWSRKKKIDLIISLNPQWKDLWEDIQEMR